MRPSLAPSICRGLVPPFAGTPSVSRGAIAAFIIRVVGAGLALASQVLLARWMGGHAFGTYSSVAVVVAIAGSLCVLGFGSAALQFIPAYGAKAETALAAGFMRAGMSIALLGGAVAAVLVGVFVAWANDRLDRSLAAALLIAATAIPAFALTDFLDGVARARQWMVLALAPPYLARPLLALGIAAVLAAGAQLNAPGAAAALAAASWAAVAVQWPILRKMLTPLPMAMARRFEFGRWLAASLPLTLFEGSTLLLSNVDVVLMSLWREPQETGAYFAAVRAASLLGFVPFAVAAAASGRFSTFQAEARPEESRRLMRETRRWCLAASLVGSGVLIALGHPLLSLFGPGFTAAYVPLAILAGGWLVRAAAGASQGVLIATGRQTMATCIVAGAVVVDVGLGIMLIPKHGMTGAAIACAVAMAIEGVASSVAAARALRRSPSAS